MDVSACSQVLAIELISCKSIGINAPATLIAINTGHELDCQCIPTGPSFHAGNMDAVMMKQWVTLPFVMQMAPRYCWSACGTLGMQSQTQALQRIGPL